MFVDVVYGDRQFSTTFTMLDALLESEVAENEIRGTLDAARNEHESRFTKGEQ